MTFQRVGMFARVGRLLLTVIAGTVMFISGAKSATPPGVKNIVLVHGANTDGSGWRGVYNILSKKGYQISIVQQPLTGLDEDVAATKRVLGRLSGPVVLVGHSYGGTIITAAGDDPKVKALVYVAALQPDVGESSNQLASSMPGKTPSGDLAITSDGFIFVEPDKFPLAVAADLAPELSQFLAHSQEPVAAAAFAAKVKAAAWRDKPSYGIVATDDRALNPELARWMYARSKTEVVEVKASHLVYISQPEAVARVIEKAARLSAVN